MQSRDDYLDNGPLSLPREFTLGNLRNVLTGGFTNAFLNTVIVTVVSAALTPAAYAVVCSTSRLESWNGFLFPLILTQSEDQQLLTLNLWNFQSEYGVDVPGLMMSILLSAAPVFLAYVLVRRWIVAGLAGLGGK